MYQQSRKLLALGAAAVMAAGILIAACGSSASASGRHDDASPAAAAQPHDAHGDDNRPTSPQALAFHDAMRKLWEDHITWTRLFIVSDAASLHDLDVTTSRLLQNQADIGDAIKPFYGDAAGTQLTSLLHDHIVIAGDLLAAAKAGDQAKVNSVSATWYANGDQIASFLSSANPKNWPLAETQEMMKDHLDLTLAEAVARLQGNYGEDIVQYDKVHLEILQMADMLSSGITAQFPDKFR